MNNYKSQYLNPRWQKKRLVIMERDEFTCKRCNDKEKTLNVHHLYYVPGKNVWDYPNSSLVTLCADCHSLNKCDFFHNQLEYIANLILCSGNANNPYLPIFCMCMALGADKLIVNDKSLIVTDEEFTAYDLIETIIYNKIPLHEIEEYYYLCISCGELIDYKKDFKNICNEIRATIEGGMDAVKDKPYPNI